MKKILVAPNAFKNSLDARTAAEAICAGLKESRLECEPVSFPIGDGGDGTCRLLHEKLRGTLVPVKVKDPLGREIASSYSLIDNGKTALIEMADASGIRLLKMNELDPMMTSSEGTGMMIKDAVEKGVEKIILGMGGSATVDGGCGILYALGVRFLDKEGKPLRPIPRELQRLEKIDTSGLEVKFTKVRIVILCDVDNLLLGGRGAAMVFGPQKGANKKMVRELEAFLSNFSKLTLKMGRDMTLIVSGGAAGGATAGLFAFLHAELVTGIAYFLRITKFEEALKDADLLITGEGKLDDQTLSGKGPMGVAEIAKRHRIPVVGLAGNIPLNPSPELKKKFDVLLPINNELLSYDKALENTCHNLRRTAESLGNIWAFM